MDKERSFHKLDETDLKGVSGGQTIGEWQQEQWKKNGIQPAPGSQNLVKQGQSGTQEFWQDMWCARCNTSFKANIMLDTVYCPNGHKIEIRG